MTDSTNDFPSAPHAAPPSDRHVVNEPIAVVGMACRFPGNASSPERFWSLLEEGIDAIREVPADRWSKRAYFAPHPPKPGRTYSCWGGFLDQIDQFDAGFFGISAREAASMDPQQRLFLEVAWESIENAGLTRERLAGQPVGVFVGASSNDYVQLQKVSDRSQATSTPYSNAGGALSIISNRLSYLLDLHGPSFTVDTACSSSLVALHCACESLRSGESKCAIVGGVNVLIDPRPFVGFSAAQMLSPDGRCRSFSAAANGYARAEGAGAIVLKPLSLALADGDPILATILATGVNQDGRTAGLSLPNEEAQAALLKEVYARAGVAADEVGYVEAHGTGTPAGDPIEARALGRALGQPRADGSKLQIGSVKSNFGHPEPASGIAGVIKCLLALQHRTLPPSLHAESTNPAIDFDDLRLDLVRECRPWTERRVCGVNSFGFGGTNAHVVLAEAPRQTPAPAVHNPPSAASAAPVVSPSTALVGWSDLGDSEVSPMERPATTLVALSAASETALDALASAYREWIATEGFRLPTIESISWTAARRRTHHAHRLAIVAQDAAHLEGALAAWQAGERRREVAAGRMPPGRRPRIAFVYNGMGSQWAGMGTELLDSEPVFRRAVERVDALFQARSGWSILEQLRRSEFGSRIDEAEVAQPAIFSVQVGLTELLRSWGVDADRVIGHSVGEAASGWASGALTLEEAVDVIWHRSRLQQTLRGRGRMLAVGMSVELVQPWVDSCEGRVSVAAINSPNSVTLSGETDDLEQLQLAMQASQAFCRFLKVDVPYHGPAMDEIGEPLQRSLNGIPGRSTRIAFYSTALGGLVDRPQLDGAYWRLNARQPVLFSSAMQSALGDGIDVIVEIGAHPVLSNSIAECQGNAEDAARYIPTMRRQEPQRAALQSALGQLYVHGAPIQWDRVFLDQRAQVSLPAYPWQREAYWSESSESRNERLGLVMAGASELLGPQGLDLLGHAVRTSQQERAWLVRLDLTAEHAWLADHQVQGTPVFPGAGYVELALGAGRSLYPGRALSVENTEIHRPLVLSTSRSTVVESLADPYSGDVTLKSKSPDGSAVLHANGRILPDFQPWADDAERLAAFRSECPTAESTDDAYEWFDSIGLNYGPAFRGISELHVGEGVAWCRVDMPATLAADAERFVLCPALLDACLQGTLLATRRMEGGGATYLPVRLKRLRLRDPAGTAAAARAGVQVTARVVSRDEHAIVCEARVYDLSGRLLAEIEGIEARALPSQRRPFRLADCLWEHRLVQQPLDGQAIFGGLPSPENIVSAVRPSMPELRRKLRRDSYYSQLGPALSKCATSYLKSALRKMDVALEAGRVLNPAQIAADCGIVPPYERMIGAMLAALVRSGDAVGREGGVELIRTPAHDDPEALWRETLHRWPECSNAILLPQRAGMHLVDILQGRLNPLEVLFPDGSTALAESLYEDSQQFLIYNQILQRLFLALVEQIAADRPLRILEIGGGTGAATSFLLPVLPAERVEYIFTDVSPQLIAAAEQKFRDLPFVRCVPLDLERDPIEQGFAPSSFDLIFAGDVLHAIPVLRSAVERSRQLLADGGLLVLMEPVLQDALLDLCLGILRGWWSYIDSDLRTDSPLLSIDRWMGLLRESGLEDVQSLTDAIAEEAPVHAIFVARNAAGSEERNVAGVELPAVIAAPPKELSNASRKAGAFWILADRNAVAQPLREALQAAGVSSILVQDAARFSDDGDAGFQIRFGVADDVRRLCELATHRGLVPRSIVHLSALDADLDADFSLDDLHAAQERGMKSTIPLLQAIASAQWNPPPRLWIVTRGVHAAPTEAAGEPLNLPSAPLWGMARVAFNELAPLRCSLVDLSSRPTPDEIAALCRELLADGEETEILLRGKLRRVPRLHSAAHRLMENLSSRDAFRVSVGTPGLLDSVELVADQPPPPPRAQEVTIDVEAAAVNFKDVAKAMRLLSDSTLAGTWSGSALGLECAGRVAEVGPGVSHLQVGDRVVAIARDCFRPRITIPSAFACRIPENLATAAAAGLPIVFLTAELALNRSARLQPGETVLIHSAAGGVGLAAIQVAQRAGAKIIATAGSSMKRDFLRALGIEHVFDSRSLAFVEEVRKVTGGRGVDVVLNSLAGAMIPASLSLLAPGGRFVEIGKRDIQENASLGLRPFNDNLSFISLDLDRLLERAPESVPEMLSRLMEGFAQESLSPIPIRTFPVSRVADAFRHMAKARQVGKVVLSMHDAAVPARVRRPIAPPVGRIRSDGTYLVTGGLSGFGLETAKWLARQGARHLVLVSRRGAASLDSQQEVLELEACGLQVAAFACNVSDRTAVAEMLETVRRTMPPLRGVFHAAMVLDDALITQLNGERIDAVFAPKMDGAWNLHTLTRDDPMELFVLYSSATTDVGNPGQANYVAACTFLDQLAEHRRRIGLPAVSVAWGPVDDVGYLARNSELHRHVTERMGLPAIRAADLLDALERILCRDVGRISVVEYDFSRIPPSALPILRTPRLGDVAPDAESVVAESGDSGGRVRESLRECSPQERPLLLKKYLVDVLAGILGTSPSRVETDRSVLLMGLDSLMAVELQTRVSRELGREIPSMRLMSGPTIDELVEEMAEEMNSNGS